MEDVSYMHSSFFAVVCRGSKVRKKRGKTGMTDYKEYIYAVYEEKSFSKAAKKLYVSQPWLSAAVKKVEQELDVRLFDRSTTPISLTEAGAYYIQCIEEIRRIEQDMMQHFQEMRNAQHRVLHIGSSMFFCTYVLPSLLQDFRAAYPHVVIRFEEGNSQQLLQRMLNGKLDVILEAEQLINQQIVHIPWLKEEIVLAVPASYAVNQTLSAYRYSFDEFLHRDTVHKDPVPLQQFQKEQFLLLTEGNDSYARSLKLCEHAGFTPHVSMYLTQMMTAYYLACEGQGIAFLRSTIPSYVTPTDAVVFYRLDDSLAFRQTYIHYPQKGISPIQSELIQFLQEAMDSSTDTANADNRQRI